MLRISEERFQTILLSFCTLGVLVLCMLAYGVYTASGLQTALLEQIAGDARDPLRAQWMTKEGTTISVEVGVEPGETDYSWMSRFDDRVNRNLLKYPPREPR